MSLDILHEGRFPGAGFTTDPVTAFSVFQPPGKIVTLGLP